jgi:hypothetical protein
MLPACMTAKAATVMQKYKSKPSVAGCIFYNKLPNIKQIENKNQFTRELKKFRIKGCYY